MHAVPVNIMYTCTLQIETMYQRTWCPSACCTHRVPAKYVGEDRQLTYRPQHTIASKCALSMVTHASVTMHTELSTLNHFEWFTLSLLNPSISLFVHNITQFSAKVFGVAKARRALLLRGTDFQFKQAVEFPQVQASIL